MTEDNVALVSEVTGVPKGPCRIVLSMLAERGATLTSMTEADCTIMSTVRGVGPLHARTLLKHARAAKSFFEPDHERWFPSE